jgi:hypothetical protein
MARQVTFSATVEQLAKTGDKPTKVVLSMGDEHAAEVLVLVGERVDVTLESKQEQIVVDGDGVIQVGGQVVGHVFGAGHLTLTTPPEHESGPALRASAEDALFEDLDGEDASEAPEPSGEPEEASDGGSPSEPEYVPFEPDDDGGSESEPVIYHALIPPAEALAAARDLVMGAPDGETTIKKAGIIWTLANGGGSLRIEVDGEGFPSGCVLAAQVAEAHARVAGVPAAVVESIEPS